MILKIKHYIIITALKDIIGEQYFDEKLQQNVKVQMLIWIEVNTVMNFDCAFLETV